VCYVLDEPTIGLHARDNQILLNALHNLSDKGNTLVVVEHDEDTIRRADHIIDIGPSAGKRGGRLVAEGTVADITGASDSQTGRYLLHAMKHPLQARRPVSEGGLLLKVKQKDQSAGSTGKKGQKSADAMRWLAPARRQLHNLQHVTAMPLQRLVAVTGVSGSGKSTWRATCCWPTCRRWCAARHQGRPRRHGRRQFPALVGCTGLTGFETIDRVLEVDQTPIGKTPRSCPATYIGFWDTIRKLFAETLEAKARGYGPGASASTPAKAAAPAAKARACAPSP
jgi:excinuclease ABC subunit A